MFKVKLLYSEFDFQSSLKFDDTATIPGQSYDIADLLRRFSRGERLRINERPMNYVDPSAPDETFSNILPDLQDPVDLEMYLDDIKSQKRNSKQKSTDSVLSKSDNSIPGNDNSSGESV